MEASGSFQFDGRAAEVLRRTIRERGSRVCDEPVTLIGILLDYDCGRRETHLLKVALEAGVDADLRAAMEGRVPLEIALAKARTKLIQGRGIAAAAAEWAVAAWAEALDCQTPEEEIFTFGAPRTLATFVLGAEAVAFSRAGKMLACAGDQTIRLWSVPAEGVPRILEAPCARPHTVTSVAFGPNGRMLVSGSSDGTVVLWPVAGGTTPRTLADGPKSLHVAVAFSPDGQTVAAQHSSSNAAQTIRVWSVETGLELRKMEGPAGLARTLAFSPDGRYLAAAGNEETILLWPMDRAGNPLTLRGRGATALRGIAFSPDGGLLASGSHEGTILLWPVREGPELRELGRHPEGCWAVVFGPDGDTLTSAGQDGTVRLWRMSTGEILDTLEGHTSAVVSVAISADGQFLASGGGAGDGAAMIRHRQELAGPAKLRAKRLAPKFALLVTLTGPGHPVQSVAFSPDGQMVASLTESAVELWDIYSGARLEGFEVSRVTQGFLAFSADGTGLACGGLGAPLSLWALDCGEAPRKVAKCLAVSADWRRIACVEQDAAIRVRHLADDETVSVVRPGERVFSAAFSADGGCLAVGLYGLIRLFAVDSGREVHTLAGAPAYQQVFAFNADGRMMAYTGSDLRTRLWSVATAKDLGAAGSDAARGLAFSPDSELLAAASRYHTVRLWSLAAGGPLPSLRGHTGEVRSTVFSHDGRLLASGSADGTVRIWRREE